MTANDDKKAQDIIARLNLQPHPEGGWYRETFRDGKAGERGAQTCIFFLLEKGQRSHWHRVDANEIWHWYAGSSLLVHRYASSDDQETVRLGPDVLSDESPQAVIPADQWQSTEAPDGWALVGCTVAPAFEFEGFELAPPGWVPRGWKGS